MNFGKKNSLYSLYFFLFLTLIKLILITSAYAFQSNNKIIQDIKIISDNTEYNSWIHQQIAKNIIKQPITLEIFNKIREDIINLSSKGGYYRVEIQSISIEKNNILMIQIDNPIHYRILFTGVSSFLSNPLNEKLNLSRFKSTNPNFQYELLQKIRSFYLENGYSKVDINFHLKIKNSFSYIIEFNIQEGNKTKIRSIKFIGSFSKDQNYYKNILLENAHPLIKEGFFNREFMQDSIKNFEISLINMGYLKAKAILNQTIFINNSKEIDIFILLFEGDQTLIKSINIVGTQHLSESTIIQVINLKINDPLNAYLLDQKINNIKSFYQEQGFLDVKIINEGPEMITFSTDYREAYIKLVIDEGHKNIVKSIKILGLDLTKQSIVEKEISFKINDVLTSKLIQESKERLYLTGLFRNVDISVTPLNESAEEKKVIISLTERDPGLFSLGIGANNERGLTFRGFTGISYENILGTARVLSLRVEGQYNLYNVPFLERSIQAFYVEPYLFNTRLKGRVGITRSFLITDFNNQVASEANRTNYSIENHLNSNLFLRWQIYEIITFKDFFISTNETTNIIEIGNTTFSATLDRRDQTFNPQKGYLINSTLEYADPNLASSPWIKYYKALLNYSLYYNLFNTHVVLAINLRGGILRSYEGYFTPYDKVGFFLGGQTTLRGFTLNEVFPNTMDLGGTSYQLQGEAQMQMFKAEIRIPIWKEIGTSLFWDQGRILFLNNLYDSTWRKSFGVSLRYNTPIGSISVEYAWKLNPLSIRNESPGALHFAIGSF